jgi:hypothetical protein
VGRESAWPSTERNPGRTDAQETPSARYAAVANRIAAVLDKLTVEDFRPTVGQAFSLQAGDATELTLTLVDARLIDPGSAPASDGHRSPFALDFRGPTDPILPQATYRLENTAVGVLEIFVVPIGRSDAGTNYEAIFT